MEYVIIGSLILGAIILLRFLGAWMLRIDEVIKTQKAILSELQKVNKDK